MKNNRYLWGILIAVLLGMVFYISYRVTYKKLTTKPITVYWDNSNLTTTSQEKVNITIYSKLKKHCRPLG